MLGISVVVVIIVVFSSQKRTARLSSIAGMCIGRPSSVVLTSVVILNKNRMTTTQRRF